MNLTGTLSDSKETLIGASIYVSDEKGKIIIPTNGVTTDVAGGYTLRGLNPSDYVTISYIGYHTVTKKVSDLGSGGTIIYNLTMQPKTSELEEFTIVAERDEVPDVARKKMNYTPVIYVGLGVLAILGGFLTYKYIK